MSFQLYSYIITAVDCGHPSGPPNGHVAVAEVSFGSVATYSCNTGYGLSGPATRTCLSNGEWSSSAPTCNGKSQLLMRLHRPSIYVYPFELGYMP